MKKPLLQDDALLADIVGASPCTASPAVPPSHVLHVWWLGQSGFLLRWNGCHVLLDPYLSDSLTRKYAPTDKPHVRLTERVVAPERLDFLDVVTSSHSHTDHLDPDTLRPLARVNPRLTMVCPESARALARERSGLPDQQIVGLDVADSGREPAAGIAPSSAYRHPGGSLGIRPVPAAHEDIERDAQGRLLFLGYLIELGPFRVYHSGDTLRYEGMAERLQPFAPDLAIFPINGRAPERRVAGNLSGSEAAGLAKDISARWVVPCHYDMFAFNTASPESFVSECERLSQPFRVLQQGERLTLSEAR